MVEIV